MDHCRPLLRFWEERNGNDPMKNCVLSLLLAGTMLLLTACGGHTHSASGGWSSDLENHWHRCECGEKVDAAAHTIENDVCTVCCTEIMIYEGGEKQLLTYNEYGACTQNVFYEADGSVGYEERFEYTYDADGNKLSCKSFSGETLNYEEEYALNASGESYLFKETTCWEDGTSSVNEYDEDGNTLRSTSYDAEGNPDYSYEYEYSPEAGWMREKAYEGDRLTSEQEFLMDEEGNQITIRYVYYNEDGSFSVSEYDERGKETLEAYYDAEGKLESEAHYENEYDAEGNLILRRTYEGDRLTEEMEFLFGADENGSWSMSGKTTTYYEDGSKHVEDNDPEGAWATEITYDADGNVVEELRYEYEEDENGEFVGSKGYRDGRLFQEVQTIQGADGETTGTIWIDYHEDGGRTVTEYDETFELVKETIYDAAGNVVSES